MKVFVRCFVIFFCLQPLLVWANNGIIGTKHNLSVTGPGEIHALTETRICIFCHTPHNAVPATPLWNRDIIAGQNYTTYDSTTLGATLSQPTGPSRLCLSCHDGTIGLGAVRSISGGVAMSRELGGRPSLIGVDLSDDHPFSFAYSDAVSSNPELHSSFSANLPGYAGNVIHCTTCHDPHDDTFGMFLTVDNRFSGLCVQCHNITGWSFSAHANSNNTWNGTGNDPWPVNIRLGAHQRNTVAENGCENCHTPHNAGGPQRLMVYREEEKNCIFACHNGNVGGKDIAAQFLKSSNHPLTMATIGDVVGTPHDPTENVSFLTGHVECQDCHNSHRVNSQTASAPNVSGRLAGVKGVDQYGTVVDPANSEYEICIKCHGDSNSDASTVNRYLNESNKRLLFAITNPSYHPVMGAGKNSEVPSIPSVICPDPTMNAQSIIYCTDCHDSDETPQIGGGSGPRGPHGSIYSPLLREGYNTALPTTESFSVYALCYRCHDRDNILADNSFRKRTATGLGGHSGHLASGGGTPCSVCHDPHGILDDGVSGSHTNLINFDATVVSPASGQTFPLFTDTGTYSGGCVLICHGVSHDATYTYP